MQIPGITHFDQCVINIALINICNQESYVGREMQKFYRAWKETTDEPVTNLWRDLHQFTIYIPHPQQQYEGLTLDEGLTKGYNVEVKPVQDKSKVPYQIPEGGHFVTIFKQKGLDAGFGLVATGIFVRPLGAFSLDIITDLEKAEYQPLIIKHPIIRDYPAGWEQQLRLFINREIRSPDLPHLVNYVDQALNQDYRPPSWNEVYLAAKGFVGV